MTRPSRDQKGIGDWLTYIIEIFEGLGGLIGAIFLFVLFLVIFFVLPPLFLDWLFEKIF